VERSEPLLWWWNKYEAYHGLAHARTTGQTVAEVEPNGKGIELGEIKFQFHRTLRVPDSMEKNKLPLVSYRIGLLLSQALLNIAIFPI